MIEIKLTVKEARVLYAKLQYKQNPAYLPLIDALIDALKLRHCPICGKKLPNSTILKMPDAPEFKKCISIKCGHKHTRKCPGIDCDCKAPIIEKNKRKKKKAIMR